ncbi:MAG: oligoendopeptidase F [Clostridiales bacterium]|nr:oligoendopeptidase F [Clostridiales bacterium]
MKKRSQIAEKYKWDLSPIYSSCEELLQDVEKLKSYPEKLASYKGKLKKPALCLEFFKLGTEVSKLDEKISVYLLLKLSENLEDAKYLELESVVSTINKKISCATAFEESELLKCGEKYIRKLMADERFAIYRLSLDNFLRNKDHVLSEKEEEIISKAGKSLGGYSDVFDNLDNLDLKFQDAEDAKGKLHEVNQHNYSELLESKDRVLRKNALISYTKGYHSVSNTIGSTYISSVEGDWFMADVYKFDSVLESSLFGGNIPKEVYTKLLESVRNSVKYVHKFYALKKKALGFKDYYMYDRLVPITKSRDKYNYEDSCRHVLNAMAVLGEDYVKHLNDAISNRWIDVYPCEKKESGGYCCNVYEPHPYILLNTVDDSRSIYTLAHELGHAMHGKLSAECQPYESYDHTIFLAEIASTVNEVLLFKYLYANAKSRNDKIAHLEKYISNIIATIFVQTLYSEFEYYAHSLVEKGEPISKELLNAKYKELTQYYYGKGVKLLPDDVGEGWMRIPHFYRAYYVYKYATGMTAAINFGRKISSGDADTRDKYIKFLQAGSSDYSINILKTAGIDLTTDEPYKVMEDELKWAISELSNLIG